ncbi:MAG: hypothetical protein RSE59_05335, partial [Clostridia bacterium]
KVNALDGKVVALDAKTDANFADTANALAQVLERIGDAHADLSRRVEANTNAIKNLAYDNLVYRKMA